MLRHSEKRKIEKYQKRQRKYSNFNRMIMPKDWRQAGIERRSSGSGPNNHYVIDHYVFVFYYSVMLKLLRNWPLRNSYHVIDHYVTHVIRNPFQLNVKSGVFTFSKYFSEVVLILVLWLFNFMLIPISKFMRLSLM